MFGWRVRIIGRLNLAQFSTIVLYIAAGFLTLEVLLCDTVSKISSISNRLHELIYQVRVPCTGLKSFLFARPSMTEVHQRPMPGVWLRISPA